jgi:hypothetical protein
MMAGRNPRATALDVIGRVNPVTKRREGGIVGLTSGQSAYVQRARQELADMSRLQEYLQRERRDRRFDPLVMRAIRDGRPVAPADIDRITGRYADRLLAYRGEVVARTETLASLSASRNEAMLQLADTGAVRLDQITKIWRATGDNRTRDTHREMDGQTVRMGQLFTTPNGALMEYPGDTSHGAPASETVQCRCYMEFKIDYFAGVT